MTSEDTKKALAETSMKIFEEAAFALIDTMDSGEERPVEERLVAGVQFSGPRTGELMMSIPSSLAAVFAENMLGADPGDPEANSKGVDAMKELLNMICGNLLPVLFGTDMEFKIEAPGIRSIEEFEADWNNPANALCSLIVEDRDVQLAFRVN